MKIRGARVICILLAAAIALAALPVGARAAPDEQSVLAELFTLNRSLEETRAVMAGLAQEAVVNSGQQEEARAELNRLGVQREERQAWFVRRMRYLHEHGSFAPFAALLGASSLGDLMERLDMVSFILRRDAALMRELRELKDAVAEKERALVARQAALAELEAQQRLREAELSAAIGQKETILSGLKEARAPMEQRLTDLEQVWASTARPVLEALGTSLRSVDMANFEPDATQISFLPPGALVRVSEKTLNQFFGKAADLKGLTFKMAPGEVSMQGDYTGVTLLIRGGFSVQGKAVLRYEPQEIKVGDFSVPKRITDQLLASGSLDMDLSRLVSPWSLRAVTANQGFMLIRAGP